MRIDPVSSVLTRTYFINKTKCNIIHYTAPIHFYILTNFNKKFSKIYNIRKQLHKEAALLYKFPVLDLDYKAKV